MRRAPLVAQEKEGHPSLLGHGGCFRSVLKDARQGACNALAKHSEKVRMTSMTYKSTVHNTINRKNLRSAGTRPRQMKTGELHVAFKGQKCSGKLKLCSSLPTHTTRVDLDSQSWAPKARMLTPYTTSGLRCPVTAARRKRNGLENLVRKVPTRKARSMPPELGLSWREGKGATRTLCMEKRGSWRCHRHPPSKDQMLPGGAPSACYV